MTPYDSIVRNWKTTTVGLIITLSGFVAVYLDYFGGSESIFVEIATYVNAGGAMGLGIYAKDK